MHRPDAADLDDIGAGAVDVGAHHVQAVGQVHHVGLAGDVFQHGQTVGHDGRQHGVHGGAHRYRVEKDMRPLQAAGGDADHAVLHRILRPQGGEGFEVLVNGPGAQVAAARHSHLRRAEPPQQRAKEVVAGPHLAGKLVGDLGAVDAGGIDLVGAFADHADIGAQLAQDLQRGHDVADAGQVFNDALAARQDGSGQNGNGSIFGPANRDFAGQRVPAANDKLFQSNASLLCASRTRP